MRGALIVVVLSLVARDALAQCRADVDCKGARICVTGQCVEPTAPRAAAADQDPRDAGWAQGAGIFGLVGAGGVLVLAIAAEATKDDKIPAIPLGALAAVGLAVTVPVANAGAASARTPRLLGLRIASWVLYGLALVDAVALIGLGAADVTPPPGLISAVGIAGAASAVLMSVDALTAASRATAPTAASLPVPALALWRERDGHIAPGLRLAWVF